MAASVAGDATQMAMILKTVTVQVGMAANAPTRYVQVPTVALRVPDCILTTRPCAYPGEASPSQDCKKRKVKVPQTEKNAILALIQKEESDQPSVLAAELRTVYNWLRNAASQPCCNTGPVKQAANHFLQDVQSILDLGSGRGKKQGLICEQAVLSGQSYYTHVKWRYDIVGGYFNIPHSSFAAGTCPPELLEMAVGLGLVSMGSDGVYSPSPGDLKIPVTPEALAALDGGSRGGSSLAHSTVDRQKPFSPLAVATRHSTDDGVEFLRVLVHPIPPTDICTAEWAPGWSEIKIELSWRSADRAFCPGVTFSAAVEQGLADFSIPATSAAPVVTQIAVTLTPDIFDPTKEQLILAPPAASKTCEEGMHVSCLLHPGLYQPVSGCSRQ